MIRRTLASTTVAIRLPTPLDSCERPNVDIMHEMVEMMIAKRSYGANIAAFRNYRSMIKEAIQQIGNS